MCYILEVKTSEWILDETHSQIFDGVTEVLIKNFTDILTGSGGMGTLTRPTAPKREGEGCLTENFFKTVSTERLQRRKRKKEKGKWKQ